MLGIGLLLLQFAVGTLSPPQPPDMAKMHYLVVLEHLEPCMECSAVEAVFCVPEHPDCGREMKMVYDYYPMPTKEAAIVFLNNAAVGLVRNQGDDFVGLYTLDGVKVEVTQMTEDVPQPKITRTVKHFSLKEK